LYVFLSSLGLLRASTVPDGVPEGNARMVRGRRQEATRPPGI